MRRPLAAAVVALGVLIACDEPVEPPTTGSLLLRFEVPDAVVAPASQLRSELPSRVTGPVREDEDSRGGSAGVTVPVSPPSLAVFGPLTKGRVVLQGNTPKDSTIDLVGGNAGSVTFSGLSPGSYTVLVYGMVNDSVERFGQTTTTVVAGPNPTVTPVTFALFKPVLANFPAPSYSLKALARYGPGVPGASGYQVEWANNAAFTGSTKVAASDTTYLIDVGAAGAGTYSVRVFAQHTSVATPRSSDPKTFTVLADTVPNTPGNPFVLRVGFGSFQDTLPGNILPAADLDIYSITACSLDTLVIETRAARLTPASGLNTSLRLLRSNGTTVVATNNDKDGTTTDSYILAVAPVLDTFKIEVTGTANTIGNYELDVRVGAGPNTVGTTCTPQVDLSKSVVTVSSATVTAGGTSTLTLTVKDAGGTQVPFGGHTVAFAVGGGASAGTIGPVTDNNNGTYTAVFTGLVAGSASEVTATVGGSAVTTAKPTITVNAGPAARVLFRIEPAGATAGTVLQPSVQVGIADLYENLISTATGVVGISIATNPAGGSLFGNISRALVGGLATFDDLKIDRAGDGYRLRAASGTTPTLIPDTTVAFSITAAAAAKLAFRVHPANALPGVAIAPPVEVEVQDGFGNRVAGATNQVTTSIGANPSSGVLFGTNVRAAVDGVASFDSLSIDKIGTGYTLKAKATLLDSALSNAFNVSVGGAARLDVTGQPSNATAGQTISPAITVTIKDAGGNTATSATDSVFIAIGADPSGGTATLSGTRRVKASAGIATFNNLSLNRSGVGYTLVLTSGSLTPDTTAAFNITSGAAFKLGFAVPPSTTISNEFITPAPQVAVQDAFGNTVTSAADLVTLAIGTNPAGGAPAGTTTRAASAGVARFDSLSINAAGTGYTLNATSGTLVAATSAAFDINPSTEVSPSGSTAFANPTADVVANGSTTSTITVTVRDPAGNPIPGQNVQLAATGTGNTPTQPATTTSASGITAGTLASTKAETKTITVTVNPGANQVVLSQQPTVQFVADTAAISASLSTATANPASPDSVPGDGVQPSQITVTVLDANSNPVSEQSVQLATSGSGTLTQPGTTDASGVATGSITRTTEGVDTITVTVNPSGTPVILTQRPVVAFKAVACSEVDASTSAVTVSPDTVTANGTDSSTVTVTVRDCLSSPLAGQTVQLALSGTGNSVRQPTATTDASGVATGKVSSTGAGTKTVTATVNPGANQRVVVQKPSVVFRPGAPAALAFAVHPPSTTAGTVMSPAVQVTVVDAQGNTVDSATAAVSLTISTVPSGGTSTLNGTVSLAASNGIALFSDLSINVSGTGYVISAGTTAYGGLGVASNSFTISAGSAANLAFLAQPTNITAGAAMDTVKVRVTDAYGNTVTSPTFSVTLGLSSNPSGGTLLGTNVRTTVSGIARFGGLSVDKAGTGYDLAATAAGVSAATSSAFNVTAGAASRLAFTVEPTTRTAGARISPAVQVTVQDGYGNTATGDAGLVTITIANDPSGAATLSGNASKNAVAAVATFDSLSIDKVGAGYKLLASRTGLTPDTSAGFNITPAAASQLAFTTQPVTTGAGSAITPAVRVTVRDQFGNTATSFNDSVTVAIGTNPAGGTLSGTKRVAAVAGIATFSTLSIDKVGTGYTLAASATGLTGATSDAFDITPAVASKLGFTVEPSAAVAGTNMSPAIQVAVQDGFGNTVTGATDPVTLAILANPSGGSIIGTATVAAENGVATFAAIAIDKAGVGYTLRATATGLASDTSAAFTVTAGAPSASVSSVSASPASGVFADSVQTSTITVVVRDGFGNPVANKAVTLAASGTGNVLTQPASSTDPAGTTAGTIASTVAETKTITATVVDGSLVLDQQPTVAFIADTGVSATKSLVVASPDSVEANGSSATTVTVTVRDKFGNPLAGQTVQIGASGTGNTITQPASVTDASGVATGSVQSTKAEPKTVTIIVNPGAGQKVLVQEPTVVFKPGPPAEVGFVVQPTNVVAGGSIGPAVEVAVQDAFGNTVPTAQDTIRVTIIGGDPGGDLRGDTSKVAAAGLTSFPDLSVDSAATAYKLIARATGLTADTSAVFDVLVGPPDSVHVSPDADSIFSLAATAQFVATAYDSLRNVIPDAVFTWGSSNEPVATVDPSSGLVTAQARGLATITATTTGPVSDVASLAVAVRLVAVNTTFGPAPGQLFSSGDLPGTFTMLDVSTFNAMTPSDLRALYDVLLVEWNTDPTANFDWTTRLAPFLELGGGVVFEDPYNVGDLAPGVTGALDDQGGTGIALLSVPSMTDGITSSFTNSHTSFTDWSNSLAHFELLGNKALGLYGRIGSACIVINGPDVGYHGDRTGTPTRINEYNLFLNEVRFAADCPLNGTPGPVETVRMFPPSVSFTASGQTAQLRAAPLDLEGTPVVGAPITWTTLNDSVATVNGTGLVTSVRNGQASIEATGSGADYALASVAEPSSVTLNAWGTEVPAGTLFNSYLMKIWGPGANNLFAVGAGGQIRRFNGTNWDTLATGSGNWLWGVWGSSATDVYAVGDGGTVLHYDGSGFTTVPDPSGIGSSFHGVWGSGPHDVFVVGTDAYNGAPVIFHFDGSNWVQMTSNALYELWSVWGTAWNDVYAVGGNGTIIHYDGVSWQPIDPSPVSGWLYAVSGSGPDNVFAVGTGGQIAHFDGSSWSAQSAPAGASEMWDVWTASSNEAIAVGRFTILRYDGSSWTAMSHAAPDYVLGVWGAADGQLRAVGSTGEVWHGLRGAMLSSVVMAPSAATVNGVGATSQFTARPVDASGNVVTPASFTLSSGNTDVASVSSIGPRGIDVLATAAGSGQALIGANAEGRTAYSVLSVTVSAATPVSLWDSIASPAGAWLWSVWGRWSNNIYAAGSGGSIYRYNGASWSLWTTTAASQIRGIWGAAENDVWAVGGTGAIYHYNGSTWSADPASGVVTTQLLWGVWGSAPNDVWAVGNSGTMLHYDGSTWSAVNPPAAAGVNFYGGVWGSSRDTIFAATSTGSIFRYDGSTWSLHASITGSPTLYRLWGTSGRDVFVVGSAGTIYRFDGTSWNQMTSNTTAILYGVWGTAANDVYAVGSPVNGVGTLMRFNGTTWSAMVSRVNTYLYAVWGTNLGNVWAVGEVGQIRRGVRSGSLSFVQQASIGATGSTTKMNLTSNGTTYHYSRGGSPGAGYLYENNLAGTFIDSVATGIDLRAVLYRAGTYYVKEFGSNWRTVNAQTGGVSAPLHTTGFVNSQSVPAVTLTGSYEILELNTGTVRRLNPTTGALLGTMAGFSAGAYPSDGVVATDGYYLYTWNHSTGLVYLYTTSGTFVTSLTLPGRPAGVFEDGFSLSYANGRLWARAGNTWYGYRLRVTP